MTSASHTTRATPRIARALAVVVPFVLLGAALPVAAPPTAAASAPVAHTAVVQSPAARTPADGRFAWPLTPEPPVVRPFDPPEDPYGPGHRGVDLGADPGQRVLAAGAGVVVFAGKLAGRGVVSIDHDVLRTTYEPVRPAVKVGDQVYQGQVIGTVDGGHAGCASACLHWGVRRGNPPEYLNPLELLAPSRVRLKPWDGGG